MSHLILVVEDDYALRENIIDALVDEDYQAHGAATVNEGLKLAKQHKYDLLITDVRLPENKDGVEGFHLLKRRLPELRCLVITGYADSDASHRAIKNQVDDWLYKPFDVEAVVEIAERILVPNKLLNRYAEMFSKLPGKLAAFFGRDTSTLLKKNRRIAFQSLYTSIKSALLNPPTANSLYSRLDKHEPAYLACLSDYKDKIAEELIAEYKATETKILEFSRSNLAALEPGRIGRGEFLVLYQAVKENCLTPEEFEMSATLRASKKEVFSNSPDLAKLRRICWGDID